MHSFRRLLSSANRATATLQTLLTQILIQGVNVCTGVLTMRVLGVAPNGALRAMILPGNLANALTLGIPASVTYNFRRYPERRAALFSAAILLSGILGLVAVVVGFFVIPIWLRASYSPFEIHVAQGLMFVAPVTIMTLVVGAVLAVEGEYGMSNQTRYLTPALTLLLLLLLWGTHTLTPITAAFAYVLPSIPVFLVRVAPLWRRFQPSLRTIREATREILHYGIRSYGIDLIGTFSVYIDQALVIGFLSAESFGAYTAAISLSRVVNMVQASIVTVLLPSAAARPAREVAGLTGRAARVSFVVTGLAAIGVALTGPFLLRIYGSKFLAVLPMVVPVFRILLVEAVLSGTTWILAQAFMAVGRPTVVTGLQAAGLGLSVPFMIILIPRYGLVGAAVSLLMSTSARLLLTLVAYPSLLKIPVPRLLLTREDVTLVWSRLIGDREVST